MRSVPRRLWAIAVCALALGALAAPPAKAAPEDPLFVYDISEIPVPPFEGPCGLAVDSEANLYVSDYYHNFIDIFTPASLPSSAPLGYVTHLKNVDPLDGPCGLAVAPDGALYANSFHRNVEKFVPSSFPPTDGENFPVFVPPTTYASAGVFDANHPTGVALDPTSGALYVNARTQVNAYDADGASLGTVGAPSLEDAYGLAVSSFPATAGYLYVPDAATDTVKVYDPATDTDNPVEVIDGNELPGGGFTSLDDSAIAVDRVSGEIYVADTGGPQLREDPRAVIHVFDATGAYEGRLEHDVIDAVPPGLAVDNSAQATQGRVYVTSGNSENSVIYAYPPGAATIPIALLGAAAGSAAAAAPGAGPPVGSAPPGAASSGPTATPSVVSQKGTLRLIVNGRMAPKRLPRSGAAPISVSVGGRIATTDRTPPPQLRSMRIELNREGRLDYAGLPTCPYDAIQPASTARALSACREALVGQGSFSADIALAGQEPYPTQGRLLVFNGRQGGQQVLLGQIYATRPFSTSFVIVFEIRRLGDGVYGTALDAALPEAMGSWGNLTGIEMTLKRRYTHRGKRHSYISAGCPAPKGFSGAVFPLVRTTFGFAGGKRISSVLSGTCKVRG